MKKILLLHLSFIGLFSNSFAQNSDFNKNSKKLVEIPKDHPKAPPAISQSVPVEEPWLYFGSFPWVTKDGLISTANYIQNIKHDTALLNSLCAWQEKTTVVDITASASLQIPIITASANGEKYCVFYEFKKFTNIDSNNVRYSVGVEVRLVANFTTLKGSVSLSLSGLGAAAAAGKISGTISLSCYGASLSKIGEAFTTTSSISAETIEKILQQVATLKSTIYDPGTVISPYVICIESLDTATTNNWQQLQNVANKSSSSFRLGK